MLVWAFIIEDYNTYNFNRDDRKTLFNKLLITCNKFRGKGVKTNAKTAPKS